MLIRRVCQRFSISPLDDRYISKLSSIEAIFSEKNLVKSRIMTEVKWLNCLVDQKIISQSKINVSKEELNKKLERFSSFSDEDFKRVKNIEAITNHDVKAVEYFIKEELEKQGFNHEFREFTHFLCTSEDINNISYSMMMTEFKNQIYIPTLKSLIQLMKQMTNDSKLSIMMSLTHGQPATPTTMGKELANFVYRLHRQLELIDKTEFLVKMNGATGSFNAHYVVDPQYDWISLVRNFIENDLKLKFNLFTTQIEPHDSLCEFFSRMKHVNTIGIGLSQDLWGYISRGYFKLKTKKLEIGSSIMPHKVNPIDLENAEGNFGIANGLLDYFCRKLPISRYQRDLSDSTVLRNIGVAAGHTILSFASLHSAFRKMTTNEDVMRKDLVEHTELLAEPIQQILRMAGYQNAYEKLKDFTRGKQITPNDLSQFILGLKLDKHTEERLQNLSTLNYFGASSRIVDELNNIVPNYPILD